MTECVVETIDDLARFEALRSEWNALLASSVSNGLFLTWEWLFTWWKHLSRGRRLQLVLVRRAGELVAAAPLALRPWRLRQLTPYTGLEFAAMGPVGSDYLDILVHRDAQTPALAALARYLAQRKLVLELARVERTTSQALGLALALKQHGWSATGTTTDTCPIIRLTGHSWDSYLASLGQEHRYNFRRRLKNLGKHGHVSFEPVQTEAQRQTGIALLVSLHRLRWDERGGSGALHTDDLVGFHVAFSRLAFERGWLRLYVLRLNGEPAAAWYGFHYGGVFYFYQSGFDPRFAKLSVGLVIMGLAIKSAIEDGAGIYDFLLGDERYKFLWAHEERELVRLCSYPPSLRGALYRRLMELKWNIKKTGWRRVPGAG
jgi:CelD/BcsL family acetyltransferase involved in cellulose biosynthesis